MTVSGENLRDDYVGDNSTAAYDYGFRIFDEDDLLVTEEDTDGVRSTLVQGTDYTVEGVDDPDGGTITLTAGNLATDHKLTIRPDLPATQPTDYRNQGSFLPQTIEDALDRATILIQQLQGQLDRSFKFGETYVGGASIEVPDPEASKVLAWNVDGDQLENVTPGSVALATPGDGTVSNAKLVDMAQGTTKLRTRGSGTGDPVDGTALQLRQNAFDNAAGEAEESHIKDGAVSLGKRSEDWSLYGLGLSNNGTDADHDLDVATGSCLDATGAIELSLNSAITKQIDAAWAVGDDAGGLDTGAVAADTVYAVWLIRRSDTGVVDVLISASFSSPTMPSNYDQKRRVGFVVTDSSNNILPFAQDGVVLRLKKVWKHVDSSVSVGAANLTDQIGPPGAFLHGFAHLSAAVSAGDDMWFNVYSSDATFDQYLGGVARSAVSSDTTLDAIGGRFSVVLDSAGKCNTYQYEGAAGASIILGMDVWEDLAIRRGA